MNLKPAVRSLLVASVFLAWAPLHAQDKEAEALLERNLEFVRARATITGCVNAGISGQAILVERPSAEGVKLVDVFLFMRGLTPGKHAVHIHATGACTPCSAAGGHFDPGPATNPAPDGNHPFHSGDLVNVEVNADGLGTMHTTTSRVTLSPGPLSVFDTDGSALIVHDLADTYCPAGPVTNCAGGTRAACGILETIR
jgi:superoxide dismutase, Cu-Zn family